MVGQECCGREQEQEQEEMVVFRGRLERVAERSIVIVRSRIRGVVVAVVGRHA